MEAVRLRQLTSVATNLEVASYALNFCYIYQVLVKVARDCENPVD